MTEQTRYAKQQEKLRQIARHAEIVSRLGADTVTEFYVKMSEPIDPPNCTTVGLPSPWTDWDEDPDHREPGEGRMPTAKEAEAMCNGCPMMQDDLCYRYALATNKQHGVWGGRRFVSHHGEAIVVADGRDSVDTPNREK
jgi:hypothetical protein